MAKPVLSLTLEEMENKLGYKISPLLYPGRGSMRFYSDLRPIPGDIYWITRREFEAYERKTYRKRGWAIPEGTLPELDVALTIRWGYDTVTLTCKSNVYAYSFTVDINLGCGFDLALLITNEEAFHILSVANLPLNTSSASTPSFFRLPREVREKIYDLALAKGTWGIEDMDNYSRNNFMRSIGDPSGFFFPLSSKLPVLAVNRQMRQEALPIAYRRTLFHLDDMDDLVKLLVAVGKVGRDNIESLDLAWQSRADSELKWDENPNPDDLSLMLPTLHAAKCVQLLKQCKRLRSLYLYFESDLILNISPHDFKTDPGIREICSLRGIRRVQICTLGLEPVDHNNLARWLKEEMKFNMEEDDDEI